MSGYVGNLSPKQADILEKFRLAVKDVLKPEQVKDDYFLTKWLRARDYDLNKAEAMLRNNCAWRKHYDVDRILDDYVIPEVLRKYYPGGLMGVDKCGYPIWIERAGRIDLRGIIRSAKKRDIVKTTVAHKTESIIRKNEELTKKFGKQVDQVNVIVDFTDLGIRHMWKPGLDMIGENAAMLEHNCPEIMKRIYVVNSPRVFPIVFKIIKPFLAEETIKKIQILGANYQDVLLSDIAADQLPKFLGGTCTDPDGDPYCPSQIGAGGNVPVECYITMDTKEMENCKEAVVGRGSTLQLDYEITTSNSVIRWQFTTDGYDIGFGVYKKGTNVRLKSSDMEEVMVSQRVNSHFVPEDGSLCCRGTGIYVVRFDNTYSWTRSKTIHYIIDVLEPGTTEYYSTADDNDDVYTSTQQNSASDAMNFFAPIQKTSVDEANTPGFNVNNDIDNQQKDSNTIDSNGEVEITRM